MTPVTSAAATSAAIAAARPLRRPAPRLLPALRAVLRRIGALDALSRERVALEALDDHALADIGLTRADVEDTLSRPAAHLRSILLRGAGQ